MATLSIGITLWSVSKTAKLTSGLQSQHMHMVSELLIEPFLFHQMKGCIKVLKDQPPNSVDGLLNALR